eukprot:1156398-Pelagomonas_calceolata.AAC.4
MASPLEHNPNDLPTRANTLKTGSLQPSTTAYKDLRERSHQFSTMPYRPNSQASCHAIQSMTTM